MKLEDIAKTYGMNDYLDHNTGRIYKLSQAVDNNDGTVSVPVTEYGYLIGMSKMNKVCELNTESNNRAKALKCIFALNYLDDIEREAERDGIIGLTDEIRNNKADIILWSADIARQIENAKGDINEDEIVNALVNLKILVEEIIG